MTEPAAFDPEVMASVALAGRRWPVPELVWRDLRRCRKELLELNGRINEAASASAAEAGEDEEARSFRHLEILAQVFDGLSNDDFDRLVMGPIHAALQGTHPGLTRAEFDGWRTTETERQMAWLTVRRQSGLFVFKGEETSDPGEGGGAA